MVVREMLIRLVSVAYPAFGLVCLAGIWSCAGNAVKDSQYASQPTPARLAAQPKAHAKGAVLTWGGVVIKVRNLRDRTILEVLSYPLANDGQPDTGEASQGRFLADRRGFLEPRDYSPGRVVTVTGPLLGYQDGTVAGADYRFPAVAAEDVRLWADSVGQSSRIGSRKPRVGVGVNVGSGGGGVGVSVGF